MDGCLNARGTSSSKGMGNVKKANKKVRYHLIHCLVSLILTEGVLYIFLFPYCQQANKALISLVRHHAPAIHILLGGPSITW